MESDDDQQVAALPLKEAEIATESDDDQQVAALSLKEAEIAAESDDDEQVAAPPPKEAEIATESDDDHRDNDDQRFESWMQDFVKAIRQVAGGGDRGRTDAERKAADERDRIDFGYRSLGALMGRDKREARFNVPFFSANWLEGEIELHGLPDDVGFVEVYAPAFSDAGHWWPPVVKKLAVVRGEQGTRVQADDEIFARRAIDVLIGLEDDQGPRIALGPRLAPKPPDRGE